MNVKRYFALATALALSFGLASCSASDAGNSASVQSVAMLMGVDLTGNSQYSGIVEAKATVKVAKDTNKTVEACFVEVGDEVQEGDPLFAYDTDALELTVSSAELEVEQLQNSITSYANQISELEKEKKKASSSDKLSYTLQIQEAELNKAEAEYNLKQKQAELERLKESIDETEVTAPVSGIVQSIGGSDNTASGSGDDSSYITLMETGTYRIKGTVSEEAVWSLSPGMPVTAYSRTDSSQSWTGTIESVNTSSTESDDQQSYYYSDTSGQSSAKYAFYVTLDSSDGLLIGQHVYLKTGEDAGQAEAEGIHLSSGYLVMDGENASVWVEDSNGLLALRSVTLGSYNEETDAYEITDGLSLEDYIAYPDDTLHEGMSVVEYDDSSFSDAQGDVMMEEDGLYDSGDSEYMEDAFVEGADEMADGEESAEEVPEPSAEDSSYDDSQAAATTGIIGGADAPAMEG